MEVAEVRTLVEVAAEHTSVVAAEHTLVEVEEVAVEHTSGVVEEVHS